LGSSQVAYIVGMVSQKGGVGKSTLARMMAREFVAGGLSTKIADLDTQQQTCKNWAVRRAENSIEPEIQVQSFASVEAVLGEGQRFDALILDGTRNDRMLRIRNTEKPGAEKVI